jgi:hypothetical protein
LANVPLKNPPLDLKIGSEMVAGPPSGINGHQSIFVVSSAPSLVTTQAPWDPL